MPTLRSLAILALPLANVFVQADLAFPAGNSLALKSKVEALLDAAAESVQDCLRQHNHQLPFQKEHPDAAIAHDAAKPELVKRQSTNNSSESSPSQSSAAAPTTSSVVVTTSVAPSTTQPTQAPSTTTVPSSTVQTSTATSAATAATTIITTTPSSSQETSTTTKTSSATPVVVDVTLTKTNSAGSTTVATSSALVGATVAVTTTNSEGKTTTQPGVVVTTTNSAGSTVTVTSAANAYSRATYTSGQVLTRTSGTSTFKTTYTPDGVSSIVLSTTTLPNGERSTLTSYATVDATQIAAASGATSTGGAPTLQTGAACKMAGVEAAAALAGGVFGLAWLL
ncbi:uncharacterized protein IWZ02DRAFT_69762 [Phyllosticta citriasiana]|uniref:uncharacterized protein n=1 Tax=Phyllosticta citriasiana TaxID=595635 RepID=UPI0030FDA270